MFIEPMNKTYRIYIPKSGRMMISNDVRTIDEPISREIGFALDGLEETVPEKDITIPKRDIEEPMNEDLRGVEHRQVNGMESFTHHPHLRRSVRFSIEPERCSVIEDKKIVVYATPTDL